MVDTDSEEVASGLSFDIHHVHLLSPALLSTVKTDLDKCVTFTTLNILPE